MNGASAKLLDILFVAASGRGLDLGALTEGLDIDPSVRFGAFARIDWDSIALICDRLAKLLETNEAVIELGESIAPSEQLRVLRLLGHAVPEPRDLYTIGTRWLGPAVLPMIEGTVEQRQDGVIIQRLTLFEGHRPCPAVFLLFGGFFRTSPVAWGNPPAKVDVQLDPRGATYFIRAERRKPNLLTRMLNRARTRAAFQGVLEELESQRSDIADSYRQVHASRDQIAAQAAELEKVNAIGRELSRHIDLHRVADVLTNLLHEDLGFRGTLLELDLLPEPSTSTPDVPPGTPEMRTVFRRNAGDLDGRPLRLYSLESASGSIGTLTVWGTQRGQTRSTTASSTSSSPNAAALANESVRQQDHSTALLERLVPWISMALDNARAYRQLEIHADDLQERVEERTARLLSANHHLVREIDERKRATDALIESEAQLRASERLASVGTLAAGIAHEINNPIGAILAAAQFAQVLDDRSDAIEDDRQEIRRALDDIVTESRRCGEIVRSVLQFSRDERTEKWACVLGDTIRRAVQLTTSTAREADSRITVTIPDKPIWAQINPIQIEQAIVNLVRNALEAGSRHVRVALELHGEQQIAMIEVRDDGPGVPNDDRMRVFEPFFTTKRDAGGTGLGLSVVHGIATEHAGTLKIESAPGGGAAALLELPAIPTPAVAYEDSREKDSAKIEDRGGFEPEER